MVSLFRPFVLSLALFVIVGCASRIPHTIVSDYGKRGMKHIAVMPVVNHSSDTKSAEMLRGKLIEELYFKGYPRVPSQLIDEKLATLSASAGNKPTPKVVGDILKVDALLYPTLKESRMSGGIVYAPTVVEAEFELRSAKTGDSVWRVQYRTVHRHYGFSRKRLELKSAQVYEEAIQEVINRALETLPDVQETIGS